MITIEEARALAESLLSKKRYLHTLAVAKLASELANCYKVDEKNATLAALLHDITKERDLEWQLQRLHLSGIINEVYPSMEAELLHGVTASLLAREEYGISDSDLLNSIRYHPTGRAGMSILEKIVFTADTVAYDRTYSDAARIRELSFNELDRVAIEICQFIITSKTTNEQFLCPETVYCYNDLIKNISKQKEGET